MKQVSFNVEGLSDDQVELARQFIELMKKVSKKEAAFTALKALLQKGVEQGEELSEQEADRIAAEAVAWARGQK